MMGGRDGKGGKASDADNEISARIGSTGRLQRWIMCLLFIPTFLAASNRSSYFFITGRPDRFRCLVPLCDLSMGQLSNSTSLLYDQAWLKNVIKHGEPGFEACRARKILKREQCFQDLSNESFSDEMLETCSDWVYDTSTFTSTAVTRFNLVCSRHYLRATLGSFRSLSFCIGSVATSYLSDRYGRKIILLVCTFLTVGLNVGTALAPSFEVFMFFIMAAELLWSGLCSVPAVYTMEIMDKFIGGNCVLVLQLYYALSTVICVGLAWLIRDYDTLILANNLPFGILAMMMVRLPESPMWILTSKRRAEAKAGSKVNGIELSNEKLSTFRRNDMEADDIDNDNHQGKPIETINMFRCSKVLQRRLVLVTLGFSAVDYIDNGLSFNTGNLKGDLYHNYFLMNFVESPSMLYSYVLLKRMDRRSLMTSSLIFCGVSLVSAALVPKDEGLQWIKVSLSSVGMFFATVAHDITFIQRAELFPTGVRATVYGVTAFFGGLAGVIVPFLTDLKISDHHVSGDDFWKSQFPFLMFGALCFIAAAIYRILPSTDGKDLPDTVEDAEKMH